MNHKRRTISIVILLATIVSCGQSMIANAASTCTEKQTEATTGIGAPHIVPAYVAWSGYAYEETDYINNVGPQIGVAKYPQSVKVYRIPGKNPSEMIAIEVDSVKGKYISAVREEGTIPPDWMVFNAQKIGTTIRPGEKIAISGNVFFRALYGTSIQVTVRRYGYGKNTSLKYFTVSNNGTFKGTIEIPKQLFGQPGKTYYNLAFWVPDRTSTVDLTMTLK